VEYEYQVGLLIIFRLEMLSVCYYSGVKYVPSGDVVCVYM